jgi:hypothetical protein
MCVPPSYCCSDADCGGKACVSGACTGCTLNCTVISGGVSAIQCGGQSNGCEGHCTTCPVGQSCTSGVCASCTSSCAVVSGGRTVTECGGQPDDCGGSCTACPIGQTCSSSGTCGACAPDCSPSGVTECGGQDNGCGGACTSCPAGESCSAAGSCETAVTCVPSCTNYNSSQNISYQKCNGASDGCTGSCSATCPAGDTCDPLGLCSCNAQCPAGCTGYAFCPCVPNCTDYNSSQNITYQKCGGVPDGCGGTCSATCPPGDACDTYGLCSCNAQCPPGCTGVCS